MDEAKVIQIVFMGFVAFCIVIALELWNLFNFTPWIYDVFVPFIRELLTKGLWV